MTRRTAALGVVPALLLAAIVAPFALHWGDLPGPMAVHWDLSGEPNGSLPPAALLSGLGGVFLAVWASVVVTVRRVPGESGSFTAGLFGMGGLLAAIAWLSVLANRGVPDWTAAGPVDWAGLLAVGGATVVPGAIGWWLGGGRTAPEPVWGEVPRLDVDDPERYVWSGRARNPVLVVGGVALIVAGLVVWGLTAVVLVVVGLLVLGFSEVRVTVGGGGVVIGIGWLGFPSWRVSVEEITGTSVEHVMPMAYGGWGYRIRPGARAVVVRGGTALRLRRRDRPDLVVTVDDAETGAGLVGAIAGVR